MIRGYQVVWPLDGPDLSATVPDLPGCTARGQVPQEVFDRISAEIDAWIAKAHAEGRPVPAPTPVDPWMVQ